MASKVSGYIGKMDPGNGTQYSLGSTAYGVCDTAAATAAKTVDMTGFTLIEGATIFVKFTNANSAANPTLNVNNTGAKSIVQYGTTAVGTTNSTNGWYAGAIICLTYDGISWVRDQGFNTNSTYYIESVYTSTAAGTAAKVGTSTNYTLEAGKYFQVLVVNSNTSQSALTLNINSKGAKPIYINGAASSTSNYTLPSGYYLVYYDGTNYYFRTDGKMTGDITGNAATASKVNNNLVIKLKSGTTEGTDLYTFNGSAGKTLDIKQGTGITLTAAAGSLTIANSGVRSIATGSTNGTISVNTNGTTADVAIKGLGSNAYTSTAYLPLAGGTMTGPLNFSGDNSRNLTWNDANWQQRIHTIDDSTADTNVFIFQQSSDAGSTWTDLMSIKDNGKVVATSFAGSGIGLTDLREAYLTWGGRNFSGSYGCIDAAMVNELGANRLMFAKAAGITIEYSRDGGATWSDYGATDVQKVGLFSTGGTFAIGKADSTNKATANGTNYQLRVTLNTGSASIYTALNKFVIYVSTNGSNSSTVTIQRALQSSPDSYSNIATDIPISGWSGYNVINVTSTTTYGNTAASQYGRIRFIFKANGGNTSYNGLNIQKIMGFGGVGWATPSAMAKTGHLYSFDASQNATFPANVTATKFIGPLQGNADSATEFSSNTTVKLTGDATGESAGSKKGWSVPVTLANSGVTAGSYGPSANAEPGYGATFNVPYITVDAKGRVTSASTKTIKIPASDEQDHRDEGYGKITPAGDTGTSAVTANTIQITAKSYNEGFTFKTGNKWLTVAGTERATTGSDILTIGHKAGLTAKSSYGSTATTASADGGTIKVTDVQYDEAGHIAASTDRTITLSQVKNTAGSTDTSSKIFLIGATEQTANPRTYSDNEVYATSGVLTAKTFNSTSLTASQAVVTDANKNLVSRGIRNNTAAGALGWTSNSTDITLVTTNTIAYWNGAYARTSSNLKYSANGEIVGLSTAQTVSATKTFSAIQKFSNTTDSAHSTDTAAAVSISGGLSVAKKVSAKEVRIDNNQTSKGVSLQYDATLEVLNFVFA